MSNLLQAISEGWRWKMGRPVEVLATNSFGNAIVKNEAGQYFRIIPGEWECELIATSFMDLAEKAKGGDFIRDCS